MGTLPVRRRRFPTAAKRRLTDLMTREVVCTTVAITVRQVRAMLVDSTVGGIAVIDPLGRPIGVVSHTDLLARAHLGGDDGASIDAAMMPLAFTLEESAPLGHAAALMAIEGVHRIFVVDETGALVGAVTALDLVRQLAAEAGYLASEEDA